MGIHVFSVQSGRSTPQISSQPNQKWVATDSLGNALRAPLPRYSGCLAGVPGRRGYFRGVGTRFSITTSVRGSARDRRGNLNDARRRAAQQLDRHPRLRGLVLDTGALVGDHHAAPAAERQRQLGEDRKRRQRPWRVRRRTPPGTPGPGPASRRARRRRRPLRARAINRRFQEARLLRRGLDQREVDRGVDDLQRQAGKPAPAPTSMTLPEGAPPNASTAVSESRIWRASILARLAFDNQVHAARSTNATAPRNGRRRPAPRRKAQRSAPPRWPEAAHGPGWVRRLLHHASILPPPDQASENVAPPGPFST